MAPNPDGEKPKTIRGAKQIAIFTGNPTVADYKQWLQSVCWKPTWDALQPYLQTLRDEAKARGDNNRGRTFGFTRIESRLKTRESPYDFVFYRAQQGGGFDDLKNDLLDVIAYALWQWKEVNSRDPNGLFAGASDLDDHHKYCKLWTIYRFESDALTPSRRARRGLGAVAAPEASAGQATDGT